MCRMAAAVGDFDAKLLVEDFLAMAKDQNEDHEKNLGRKGHFRHEDGWGAAFIEGGMLNVVKSPRPCCEDERLLSLANNLGSPLLLLHARKAIGSSVCLENTHPFREAGYVFCHNGYIKDELDFDEGKYRWNGESDSHRFFCHLLGRLEPSNPVQSLRACLSELIDYTSANLLLLCPAWLIAAAKFRPPDSAYYRMKVGSDGRCIVVSSEVLPNFGHLKWQDLNDGDMAEVNLDSKALTIHRSPKY